MKTDTEKTLHYLEQAGSAGIHSFTLNHLVGTTRCAARIKDLKDKGHNITSVHEKMGDSIGVRYFLNPKAHETVSATKQYRWIFDGGMARRVEA